MTHGSSPRDAWLAWQAEIGTEEVVLAKPWKRPAKAPADPSLDANVADAMDSRTPTHALPTGISPERATRATGGDFFRSIAEQLAAPGAPAPRKAAPSKASPHPPSPPEIPDFKNLDGYRAWLDGTWPQWFPGTKEPPVHSVGHLSPALALVELHPVDGVLFGGDSGVLLDRMIKAIGLDRDSLYLTALMKTAPAGSSWARRDTARMLPALLRELRLAGCEFVLLLGEACAQAVLRTGRGIPALAEQAAVQDGVTFAATWHPADLLRDESLKRQTWAQLQWIRARLPKRGS